MTLIFAGTSYCSIASYPLTTVEPRTRASITRPRSRGKTLTGVPIAEKIQVHVKLSLAACCQRGTVTIMPSERAAPSFVCPVCAMESFHPKDIEHGYCGNCHEFTGSMKIPGEDLSNPGLPK